MPLFYWAMGIRTQLVETNAETHERFSDDSEYSCGNNF